MEKRVLNLGQSPVSLAVGGRSDWQELPRAQGLTGLYLGLGPELTPKYGRGLGFRVQDLGFRI